MEAFQDVTATRRIFQLKKRIRAVSGGTWASKTISILIWLIDYCQSAQNKTVTIVAESVPHLKLGAIRDFQTIMTSNGYWEDQRWNESNHIYKFSTDSILEFISFDKFGKAHGPRRDVLFINEANNIPYNIADQLITRTREIIWLDWNPSEDFWFYTDFYTYRKEDTDFMGDGGNYPPLTYLDNEALDEVAKNEVESHKSNTRWWTVYGLGKKGEPQGRIYTGWRIIDEIPHEARLERYGLDFGYNPDPAAIVAIYYYNGGYIFDEILYGTRLDNNALAGILRNLSPALVIADSAEPKGIEEIQALSIQIIGAEKGKDSRRYGIKAVQSQRISVTSRSLNIIKEYRNYFQAIDKKTGAFIVGETEGADHSMDAIRYGLCSILPMIARRDYLRAIPRTMLPARRNPV